MSWTPSRWVWQLEAPLHVGMPPSGSLNRCRLYVPARALWGALTAEAARRAGTGFPSYEEVGEAIRRDVRLTYLYPGEQTGGEWRAWLPRYKPGQGLVWQREDDQDGDGLPDRLMRSRLLVTRPGTAIDPVSDAAAEGTLRETECIGQYWRTSTGDVKPVGLVGHLLVRQGSQIQEALEEIEELFLGGDTRYGLGRVRRVEWRPARDFFEHLMVLDASEPAIKADRILAHSEAPGSSVMRGDREALLGWGPGSDRGLTLLASGPLWKPGSVTPDGLRAWCISTDGVWRVADPAA
jgi:hypothetical protein